MFKGPEMRTSWGYSTNMDKIGKFEEMYMKILRKFRQINKGQLMLSL
jgi:hypothetical protein